MTRLEGKIALVTGAQQGIGRSIAVALSRAGADVGINYLDDRAEAEKAMQEVRAAGRHGLVVRADVGRPGQAQALVAEVVTGLGGLDILVNNAGVFPRVAFLEMSESDWDFVLDVNLKGAFFCAQAAARVMVAGGRRGSIINVASQAIRGAVRGVHYSASKGGVVAMTRGDGARAGAAWHPRQRWHGRSRSGAWPSPTTSPPWSSSSPATTRASSPGRRCT